MSSKVKLSEIDLKDALDLAIEIELEAKERYLEFARQIGSLKSNDAGDFFTQMSQNEEKHALSLKEKRVELFGNSPSRISLEDLYEYQEIEAPEFDRAKPFLSTKAALEVARDCEVKAYNFFDKAMKIVIDPKVKELFLELRNEEEEHRMMVEEIIKKTKCDGGSNDSEVDEPNGL